MTTIFFAGDPMNATLISRVCKNCLIQLQVFRYSHCIMSHMNT